MDAIAPAASLDLDREPLPIEAWYVACASAELGDEAIARRIHDRPIVLFRGADGQAGALHDRCPHRGVALSLGKVTDGAVACAYHGWRFGRDGACVHIPSLYEGREVAAGVAADAYPCVEQDAYIWVWTGKGSPSPAQPLSIPAFGERAWVQAVIDLACEAMLPIENNLDVSHPYFTHPNTHPQWFVIERIGFRDNAYRLTLTDTGLRLTGGRDGFGGVSLAFGPAWTARRSTGPARPADRHAPHPDHTRPLPPALVVQHRTGRGSADPQPGRWTATRNRRSLRQDRRVLEIRPARLPGRSASASRAQRRSRRPHPARPPRDPHGRSPAAGLPTRPSAQVPRPPDDQGAEGGSRSETAGARQSQKAVASRDCSIGDPRPRSIPVGTPGLPRKGHLPCSRHARPRACGNHIRDRR